MNNEAPLLTERRGPVLLITLNRPERLNAWIDAIETAYRKTLQDAELDPDIRAIVLTGAGRAFCAGADMDELKDASEVHDAGSQGLVRAFPLRISKPMIAAINGPAIGLGLVHALYCDVRFSTPTAKLSTVFSRRGLIAEYGTSWLLTQTVGRAHAMDLLLSGRIILGDEALAMGLVNRVYEPDKLLDAALAYANDIAVNCSPTAVGVIKAQLNVDAHVDVLQALARADSMLQQSFGWPDVTEGVRSFIEKRPPAYPGLDLDAVSSVAGWTREGWGA